MVANVNGPQFSGGANIAIKCPAHTYEQTIAFYRDTLGLPLIEEEKKQGLIVDYKVFLKQTKNTPEDWDICVAVEYKNYAAMDGLTAKIEAARDKILGGKAPAQELSEKRSEIREIISSELMEEIFLK